MREASYYAEQFFPEHGIQYVAIADNFDTEHDNIMAPFLFAMNEVYLWDGSHKVKDVLRSKRESGQYCACPPYGYRKDQEDKHRLAPDEMTAPVVERIFKRAAARDSSRKTALDLNADGIIPPLVDKALFQRAQENLGRGTRNYRACDHVRKNIFGGIAVCVRCGYSLCPCGTVFKGEREKYWYLSRTHQRQDIPEPCGGVRIRYADLMELVRQDLNSLLVLSDQEIEELAQEAAPGQGARKTSRPGR